VDLLPTLLERDLTPALCFVFSRRDAEAFARAGATWMAGHAPLAPEVAGRIEQALADLDRRRIGAAAETQARAADLPSKHGVYAVDDELALVRESEEL